MVGPADHQEIKSGHAQHHLSRMTAIDALMLCLDQHFINVCKGRYTNQFYPDMKHFR